MSKTLVIFLIFFGTSLVTYTAGQADTCKAEEVWKKKDGRDGCFCIDKFSVPALKDVKPDLSCDAFEMVATFHKCQFKDWDIFFNKDSVRDKICYDIIDDDVKNTITIKAPIHAGSCAFKSQVTTSTDVTYTSKFEVDVTEPGSVVQRLDKISVTLQCSYPLDLLASLHKTLNPIIIGIDIFVDGFGVFKIYMSLFKKSDYTDPYTGSEVSINTEDFLYVGVVVYGGDESTLLLVMKNCYATPEDKVDHPIKYDIIKDSCPNDKTVNVVENGASREGKFSVKMFKFVGNYDKVFLHCKVSLCDKRAQSCVPGCSRGSRSDGTQTIDASAALTLGPIKRSGESSSSTITSAHIFWTLLIPALILIQSL